MGFILWVLMFFLVPRVALFLFACFLLALAWRGYRQRHAPPRKARRGTGHFSHLPLVPAGVMRGADRTWVVFTTPDCLPCDAVAERLRHAEPSSQVTEIDVRREPRMADAYGVRQLPAVLRANRYGQVEARLIGLPAIESVVGQVSKRP